MKKILCLILTVMIAVPVFSACGKKEEQYNPEAAVQNATFDGYHDFAELKGKTLGNIMREVAEASFDSESGEYLYDVKYVLNNESLIPETAMEYIEYDLQKEDLVCVSLVYAGESASEGTNCIFKVDKETHQVTPLLHTSGSGLLSLSSPEEIILDYYRHVNMIRSLAIKYN